MLNILWGPYPLGLPLTSLRDLPLLFVYFQVNNGVLYVLAYVEDIYIRVLSLLVSFLNPNHFIIVLNTCDDYGYVVLYYTVHEAVAPVAQRYLVTL